MLRGLFVRYTFIIANKTQGTREYPRKVVTLQSETKKISRDMATYTITLNERTTSGKALKEYLQALGVFISKVKPKTKSSYLRSQEDKLAGRVEKFSSSEEMFKSLGI